MHRRSHRRMEWTKYFKKYTFNTYHCVPFFSLFNHHLWNVLTYTMKKQCVTKWSRCMKEKKRNSLNWNTRCLLCRDFLNAIHTAVCRDIYYYCYDYHCRLTAVLSNCAENYMAIKCDAIYVHHIGIYNSNSNKNNIFCNAIQTIERAREKRKRLRIWQWQGLTFIRKINTFQK